MAKGPKGFSDIEKIELKNKLCTECEKSWALHGYKKTSVGELTTKIGISIGSFYLLYSSKEDLFCETLERIQNRLKSEIRNIVSNDSGKKGFIESMKWQFKEYDSFPFLYDFGTPDFLSFLNKLPQNRIDSLKFNSVSFFHEVVSLANLKFKIEKEKTYALVNTLLYTVTLKERLNYNHFEIFDFLLDNIVDNLFLEDIK